MSFNRHFCRLSRPHPRKDTIDQVWISYDIFDWKLQFFTLTPSFRRHVGLAPGPLEARKRATKRRLMGLAPSGAAIQGADPGFQWGFESWMFGKKRNTLQTFQWQEPFPPPILAAAPLGEGNGTPTSLNDSSLTRDDLPTPYSKRVEMDVPLSSKAATVAYPGHQCRIPDKVPGSIEHCESLDDIRRFFNLRRIPSKKRSQLSSSAFQRLLDKGLPIETLLEFLEDSELNFREAENLRALLAHHLENGSASVDGDEVLLRWIQTQIVLGSLPFQDIPPLLEVVNRPSNTSGGVLCREIFNRRITEGVRRCTICGSSDAKERVFNTILVFVSCGILSPELELLGMELIKMSLTVKSGLMDEGACSFISNYILARLSIHSSPTAEAGEAERVIEVLETIKDFPDPLMEACIQSTSKAVINRIEALKHITAGQQTEVAEADWKLYLEQLHEWWSMLQFSGILSEIQKKPSWQDVEHTLGLCANDVIVTYLRFMDQMSKCFFLIRHCYVPKLIRNGHVEPGGHLDIQARVEAQFRDICNEHPSRSPFTNLLLTFRLANQPRAWTVDNVFDIIHSLGMSGTTLTLLKNQEITHVRLDARLIIGEINHYLEQNEPRTAYRLFQTCATLPLEYVPALAEEIIANPNLYTHTALYYRHSRQRWLDQLKPSGTDSQYLTMIRTRLLNRMAYAYSRSRNHPSVSFRQVYKCYVALKTAGLPLTPDCTKALTFAGVVRYLQCGVRVSTVRYNKIWSLVKEVEGEKVADRLDDLVFFSREKLFNQNMYRKRKERALGLPRGSLLTEEQLEGPRAEKLPQSARFLGRNRRQRMHWFKPG